MQQVWQTAQTAQSGTGCTEWHRPHMLPFIKYMSSAAALVCRNLLCLMIAARLTVPFLGHLAKAVSSGREDESVVMIMVVELQTLPWILLHVNRRLKHLSVGVQEVAAHQQRELFWRFHLQNVPRRWREAVFSSETLPPTYLPKYTPTHLLLTTHLPTYLSTWLQVRWTQKTLVRQNIHETQM